MSQMQSTGKSLSPDVLANFGPEFQIAKLKTQSASIQRSRIRELAKKLTAQQYGRHCELSVQLAHWLGYRDLHELNEKVLAGQIATTATAFGNVVEILTPPPHTSIAYQLRIDGSLWHLMAAQNGPELQLVYRPSGGREFEDQIRGAMLGLFPVLVKTDEFLPKSQEMQKDEWVLTRYGTDPTMSMGFLSDQGVEALGRHFGIPIHGKRRLVRKQRAESETCFLCSPAFKALRLALRTGRIPLPRMSAWNSGLSSLWCHFVAASDGDFASAKFIAEIYLKTDYNPEHSLNKLNLKLKELWETVPNLGDAKNGLEYGFSDLVESWRQPSRNVPSSHSGNFASLSSAIK